jgi:hypothetical protein
MFRSTIIGLSLLALFFVGHIYKSSPQALAQQAKQEERTQASALAFGTCARAVENAAKYDLRWTSWGKFYSADGIAHPDGKILFHGDEAEAQNGFGGWVRVNYFCVFDPKTKQAEVSIKSGRLPK